MRRRTFVNQCIHIKTDITENSILLRCHRDGEIKFYIYKYVAS